MKKVCAVSLMALLLASCSKTDTPAPADPVAQHQQDVAKRAKLIQAASQSAAGIGLTEWSKKEPDAAKEAAAALAKNIKEVLLPYFADKAALATSAEVQAFLNSSLFKDMNPTMKNAIITASTVLDLALPVPGSDKIDADALAYIRAFLDGLNGACEGFLGTAKEKAPGTVWLK